LHSATPTNGSLIPTAASTPSALAAMLARLNEGIASMRAGKNILCGFQRQKSQ
jgi:hypothetical protein